MAPRTTAWAREPRVDVVDAALCIIYLLGIYLGVALSLPGGVPLPAVLAGLAGLLLAFKHAPEVPQSQALPGIAILVVAALSILFAEDLSMLPERFKGFVQLAYSLVIGYAFFLALRNLPRAWLSRVFLALVAAVLAGSVLEVVWPAFKQLSDLFRGAVFDAGVYDADRRDIALYGRVRPKLFTQEPSYLTFNYTLFAFCWYALARVPGKAFIYIAMLAAGYFVMRGPTLLLGITLIPVYEVFLNSRRAAGGGSRLDGTRALIAATLAGFVVVLGLVLGWEAFALRIEGILAGRDPSFFARIVAPAMVAIETISQHPLAGIGLTGWEKLDAKVAQLYATTDLLSLDTQFDGASHSLTNYFWALWIFLGLFWGTAMVLALSWLLRSFAVPSLAFCWLVWIGFGHAAGSFVGPRTWAVMMLAAAVSLIHARARQQDFTFGRIPPAASRPAAVPPLPPAVTGAR